MTAKPVAIGNEKQLFFDDFCMEELVGVRRHLNKAKKHPANPLLHSNDPNDLFYAYGNVLVDPDQKQFQMWYHRRTFWGQTFGKRGDQLDTNCHATSTDGIHWGKSKLNIFQHDRLDVSDAVTMGNDIYIGSTVFYTPDDPDPQRRYRMLVYLGQELYGGMKERKTAFMSGYGVLFSPDGLHWEEYDCNPVIQGSDMTSCFYDPVNEEYVAFPKACTTSQGSYRRCIAVSTSKDFLHWGTADIILAADAMDDAGAEERLERFRDILLMDDPSYYSSDMYGMTGMRYEGLLLGFIKFYDRSGECPAELGYNDEGVMNIQLAYTRDSNPYGFWNRESSRQEFLSCGQIGSYDGGSVGITNTVLEVGDELWFYYTGSDRPHACESDLIASHVCLGDAPFKGSSINLATLRRDGFISIDCHYTPGRLITKLVTFTGNELQINANAKCGQIAVEVLDEQGQTMDGYSQQDCLPFSEDSVRGRVAWKSGKSLSTLQDKPIRLVFHMKMARLYAFQFVA
jgi:hypothetical protein